MANKTGSSNRIDIQIAKLKEQKTRLQAMLVKERARIKNRRSVLVGSCILEFIDKPEEEADIMRAWIAMQLSEAIKTPKDRELLADVIAHTPARARSRRRLERIVESTVHR